MLILLYVRPFTPVDCTHRLTEVARLQDRETES